MSLARVPRRRPKLPDALTLQQMLVLLVNALCCKHAFFANEVAMFWMMLSAAYVTDVVSWVFASKEPCALAVACTAVMVVRGIAPE